MGTHSFVTLSQSGPPVVFIQFARCFVSFPLQHARPGPSTVFIPLARYFVGLSPSPTPRLHLWYTGRLLLHRPFPPPPPKPGSVGLDLAGTQNQVRLISRLCFCQLHRSVEIQNPRHRQTDIVAHFGTSFLSVSFVGLSYGGLQNRPRRDRFCQFLSLGCHLGGCKIGLAETVSVSFFRWVVIWGVAESASQRLLTGRNALS